MARMYDVLRRGFRYDERDDMVARLVTDVAHGPAKVFEITNVWQYACAKGDFTHNYPNVDYLSFEKDFPIVTPPFGWSWWEWSDMNVATPLGTWAPDRTGLAVECIDLWDETVYPQTEGQALDPAVEQLVEALRLARDVSEMPVDHQERVMNDAAFAVLLQRNNVMPTESRELARRFGDRIRWIVNVALVHEQDGEVWGPVAVFIFPIAPNGSLLPASHDGETREILNDILNEDIRLRDRQSFADCPFVCAGAVTVAGRKNFDVSDAPKPGEPLYAFKGNDAHSRDMLASEIIAALDANEYETIEEGHPDYEDGVAGLTELHEKRLRAAELSTMGLGLYPLLQAIAFTHLRNVEVLPVAPPPKLMKKAKRKHGIPLVRYHTIEITPLKEALAARRHAQRSGLAPGSIGLTVPRGHFAHYGDCCPGVHLPKGLLFGKYPGRFWIKPHLRGNARAGVIVSDYKETV